MKKRLFAILIAALLITGMLPLSVFAATEKSVSSVSVYGVTEPAVGNWPSNSASVLGTGYSVDTNHYVYDTVHLGEFYIKEIYYVMNGVGFYDDTGNEWLDYNSTFTAGRTYIAYVYLKADAGYAFDTESIRASLNSNNASVIPDAKDPTHKICITREFQCNATDVDLIMINNVKAPVAGESPDAYAKSISLAYPEYYTLDTSKSDFINGIRWLSESGRELKATDTFVEGETYKIDIAIAPTKNNGKAVSAFLYTLRAMINGEYVETEGDWNEVYVASTQSVRIYYTLPAAVAPAEPEIPDTPDTVIHSIEISDVYEPVAFGIPAYSATVPDGADYSVFTDAAYYGRIYDGILWHNTTDNVTLNPEYDRVVPENTYNVLVFLEAAEGYTFDMDDLECTIDGESAQWYLIGDNPRYIGVYTSFEVPEYTVDTLDIMINVPVAGDHPAFYAETNDLAYYPNSYGDNDTGIVWEDITEGFEGELTREDTFLAGHEYRVSICVTPARGCTFATTDDGYSSVYADVNGQWASVVTSDTYPAEEYVFVVYDFIVDGEVDVMVGDINGDDTVNGKDGNLLSRILSGGYALDDITTADIDGDGMISGKDANLLKIMIAGNT